MKNRLRFINLVSLVLLMFFFSVVSEATEYQTSPVLNKGEKWRMVYYEGGAYANYQLNLVQLVKSFMKLGWITETELPKLADELDNRQLWGFLANVLQSKYITFVKDGFYSTDWESEKREAVGKTVIKRLSEKKDIDLIIGMGTWAGQDLANNKHSVPVIVMSTSDPVRANIIKNANDSGFDHVFARCDPTRYTRQIRLFHRIVNFKKIGVILENSDDGRIYSAWHNVVAESQKRGFSVVECFIQESDVAVEESARQCLECIKKIAPQIDAIWISDITGVQSRYLPKVIPVLLEYKIPSWTILETLVHVERGVLMGLSKRDFSHLGMFYAKTISTIFNGVKPRDLDQIFEDLNLIAINTKTAELIGFPVPKSILRIADEVYHEIE